MEIIGTLLVIPMLCIGIIPIPYTHRQENRRLVGHFYDMKNQFWAVGCGLGWAVE